MILKKNLHIFIFKKLSKDNFIKFFNFGTNSKNCFLIKKKKFFFSIMKKIVNLYQIKIIQSIFSYIVTKIIFFLNNKSLFKKNLNFNFFFSNIEKCCKISFNFSNFKIKKKNIFFFVFNIFYLKIKNLFSKFNYFIKKKKKSFFFSHNDVFKDNILFFSNFLITIIDFNNFFYISNDNDFINILLNYTNNYCINLICIEENFKKKKKKFFFNNFHIFNIYISRIYKFNNYEKIKNPKNYIKKYFYDKKI